MSYFTNATKRGRVRRGAIYWAVGVLESPTSTTPVGEAWEVGHTRSGAAVWKLRVQEGYVEGRLIIEDGPFVPVDQVCV